MMISAQKVQFAPREDGVRKRYTGEVVYIYGFDTAYEMSREPVKQLMGQPVQPFAVDPTKRSPRTLSLYKPQMVRLPPLEREGPLGPIKLDRIIKFFPVGAVSITIRAPFEVEKLEDLVVFHDLQVATRSLHEEVRLLADDVRRELAPYFVRPVPYLVEEEAYTVFCLDAPVTNAEGLPMNAEAWFQTHRRQIAALLTQESDVRQLSKQEGEESTSRYLSYYQNDLVVIDWDAALIVDERADFDDPVYIMELANLQLAEMEAYDRLLDESLDRSYRDLANRSLRSRSHVLHQLKELRIDMTRLSDELSNITKFFGDWHLARIYENLAARFHLGDWHRALDEKLQTLDELYQVLQHDQINRWMLLLEGTIVLLFIIDLVILFMGIQPK